MAIFSGSSRHETHDVDTRFTRSCDRLTFPRGSWEPFDRAREVGAASAATFFQPDKPIAVKRQRNFKNAGTVSFSLGSNICSRHSPPGNGKKSAPNNSHNNNV